MWLSLRKINRPCGEEGGSTSYIWQQLFGREKKCQIKDLEYIADYIGYSQGIHIEQLIVEIFVVE
jgi:hypothetical protein